jgi:hypothetical protein
MDGTPLGNANHCLPLTIANESGWWLENPRAFTATGDGGTTADSVQVRHEEAAAPSLASSHFGNGILSFRVPFLFRTPAGFNLWARGPANRPKDGCSPLEGVIETDWAVVTFTMNWQLTRPGAAICFAAGEPFCMVTPVHRGDLDRMGPARHPLDESPDAADYLAWSQERARWRASLDARKAGTPKWQHDYFQGRTMSGDQVEEHHKRLDLQSFDS